MVSGCSNGGMVAMALAYHLLPAAGRSMLEYGSPFIFGAPVSLVSMANWPKYSDKFLKLTCEATWGKRRLSDAIKHLVIPAFQLDNGAPGHERSWEPILFHNVCNEGSPMQDELASDVVLYATTAPTYFPNHKGYIDGGMFDLEPSSSALMLAMSPQRLNLSPNDICLLSMGTGAVQRYVPGDTAWGVRQWLPKLMDMMWDGMVMKSINTCTELLGDQYHRLQMHLDEDITLDDPAESMSSLHHMARFKRLVSKYCCSPPHWLVSSTSAALHLICNSPPLLIVHVATNRTIQCLSRMCCVHALHMCLSCTRLCVGSHVGMCAVPRLAAMAYAFDLTETLQWIHQNVYL
eukprot:TRINITY_DN8547_c0_g2_i4.p1 TRINITY_DN8547_c0_g2~~TRINITY_DN8547_c0_g2_i4.p1  ORF type:complete len:348 (+),score=61.94 TRINITY_DN8547_c0_g2_i4:245-1288(+)